MRIHNFLPRFLECLARWEKPPSLGEFLEGYYEPIAPEVEVAFDDGRDWFRAIRDLDWPSYRAEALRLDPAREEARLRGNLGKVEAKLGLALTGDLVLFGSFATVDGYARFDRGAHRVFIGADEDHGLGEYLDVLETHELTHVARESRPGTWAGWGLDVGMSHDEFSEHLPVAEHLFNEGFSCAVSELCVPRADAWHYAYQGKEELARVFAHGDAVDRVIHAELRAHAADSDWGRLYSPASYHPRLPVFTHYVWGWQWAKALIRDFGQGDPAKILDTCSKDWLDHALRFRLAEVTPP